jgi:hypothetical protein
VVLEAVVIDWLPSVRIPSWPEALGSSTEEAGDTFAVRPVQLTVTRRDQPAQPTEQRRLGKERPMV